MNPHIYNFKQFQTRKILMLSNATNQPKSNISLRATATKQHQQQHDPFPIPPRGNVLPVRRQCVHAVN